MAAAARHLADDVDAGAFDPARVSDLLRALAEALSDVRNELDDVRRVAAHEAATEAAEKRRGLAAAISASRGP